ncbi:MAG: GNAT family N-acetyltransferase [Clostridia bacterium]|nr:GNAT family N-acetyltransferase [Clostridia bacterium]
MEFVLLAPGDALWPAAMAYAANCPWSAGPALARDMARGALEDWERVIAAVQDGRICGFCTAMKRDCIPDAPYTPYIGYVFVDEACRGHRLSERMIRFAEGYLRSLGFEAAYLTSDHENLYEKYGYEVIGRGRAYWGGMEKIYRRRLIPDEKNGEVTGGANMTKKTFLPRCTPAQAGLEPQRIAAMIDEYREKGCDLHSFLLVRHGQVLCEGYYAPYGPEQLQTVYSLSKTFTSLAMGIAEDEGIVDLDARVIDIFADELAASGVTPGKELSALTLRHLLRMSTGQKEEPFGEGAWADLRVAFLKQPLSEMPGEVFRYNTAATYMLSAALKKKGVDLEEYLEEKLLAPMGIHGTRWMRDPHDVCVGGFGFSLYPEVNAKLGALILADGVWEGKQLVPRSYLLKATRPQIYQPEGDGGLHDWNAGYGYQIWMCKSGAFRGDGMFGQLCIMDRRTDSVMAMTALCPDIGMLIDIYTRNVLVAYRPEALEEDAQAMDALHERLASLRSLRPLPQDGGEPVPQALLGRYDLPVGCLALSMEGDVLVMEHAGRRMHAARGAYCTDMCAPFSDELTLRDKHDCPMMTTYAVKDGVMTIVQYDVEFIEELTLTFAPAEGGAQVRVQVTSNPSQPEELFCLTVKPE